jgi:uncharacterized hydrophobic protein (TIGR00271 family)
LSTKVPRLEALLHGSATGTTDLALVEDKLFFDRGNVLNRYIRFFVLLLLATVIATGGVLKDSTASVIGAMIVAPLMTPIMAAAFAVVLGDGKNIVRSILITAAGMAATVGLAFVLAKLIPGGITLAGNSQITSRVSPGLLDFVIALAAGAAGAFGVGREDVSDALPGVAIAISLVPPLCVVGVCFAGGSPSQAFGALLLFLTNFFAIIVAGGVVFALMGYGKAGLVGRLGTARRRAMVWIALGVIIILAPLGATSFRLIYTSKAESGATAAVGQWLNGTGYESYSVQVAGGQVNVVISGQGPSPVLAELAALLKEKGLGGYTARVATVPAEQTQVPQ